MLYRLTAQPGCHTHPHFMIVKIVKHIGNFWITLDHITFLINYLTMPEMHTLHCNNNNNIIIIIPEKPDAFSSKRLA